jgi:urease accessory protein
MDMRDIKFSIEDVSLLQLSDSFFPTGLYTTSNGLETLFYEGKIKKPKHVKDFIKTYLLQQVGPIDCTAVGNIYDHIHNLDLSKILMTDQILHSTKLVQEVREASVRSGIQLLKCVGSFMLHNRILNQYKRKVMAGKATGVYPVSFAIVCNSLNIPKYKAGLIMLYGFTSSIVSAAIRLGMLQHFEAQKIIHDLKPSIISSLQNNMDKPLSNMWQFAPVLDIILIKHEQMDSRMFIT